MSSVVSNYQIGIDAKPEDVFAYVSDLTKHGEWSENLTVESVSDGEVAVGREDRSTGKMMASRSRTPSASPSSSRPHASVSRPTTAATTSCKRSS